MFFELPTILGVPARLAVWCWVIVLPGLALASLWLRGRRVPTAEAAALTLGFGLMAVPLAGYVFVAATFQPLQLWVLLAAAGVVNVLASPFWIRGLRLRLSPSGPWLWAGLGVVLGVAFLTYDAGHLSFTLQEWESAGTTDCFRRGAYQFLGHESSAWEKFMPPISRNWDGSIRGNVTLASTYALVFGEAGFRLLRCTLAVLLGLLGWILGRRATGNAKWGLLGLAFFGLNPYVVMIQDLDTNVMAFTWAAFLLVLADHMKAGPVTLGVVAGFTVGLGMNLLPLVFLVPLCAHIWINSKRRWLDLPLFLVTALAVGSIWLAYVTELMLEPWVEPFTHRFLGFEMKTHRLMVFPFGDGITRGPQDPFPAFLHYPLHMVRTLGLVLSAAAVIGLWRAWKTSRTRVLVLAMWGTPVYLALSLQSVMVEEDQLRVLLAGFLPVVLLSVEGTVHMWDNRGQWRRYVVVFLVLGGLCSAASWLEFPVDPRVRDDRWMVYMGGVEALDRREELDKRPVYDLAGEEGNRRRRAYRVPMPAPNYFEVLPPSRSEGRHDFGRWSDFHGNRIGYPDEMSRRIP